METRKIKFTLFDTQDVNRAQLFETRTEAFHHLLELGLIKRCLVQEIKD